MGAQAGDGVVDVVDCQHDAMPGPACWAAGSPARRRTSRGCGTWTAPACCGRPGSDHRDLAPDAVESDGAVRPKAFDLPVPSSSMPSSVKNAASQARPIRPRSNAFGPG